MTVTLEWSILGPAFAAGLLVLATHVPLGREVLRRGIIFLDLAVAQLAALGVLAGQALGLDYPLGLQLSAGAAAVAGALLLTWTERRWPRRQEALIGSAFVLSASLGLLLLAGDPHGGEDLKDLLAGQILWVDLPQLALPALLSALLLAAWFGARRRLGDAGFYVIFALAVTLSVQLIGVYLVFASLILPALATRRLWSGWLLGALGYLLGLLGSAWFDLPTGPLIVCTLAAIALLAAARRLA